MTAKSLKLNVKSLLIPIILLVVFWTIAVVLWLVTDRSFFLLNFGFIGTSVFIGLGLYEVLPRKKKPIGRKTAQALVGLYMLGFLGVYMHENMQLEGFFFYLSAGILGGSVIHYLVAKVFGPLLFGRGWCGWACWTAAVLDLLPYTRNKRGRVAPGWEWLRQVHFLLSLCLVLVLLFVLDYQFERGAWVEVYWLAAGNLLYFALAIGLAIALKDNRAFCKYVCPIAVPLKLTSRFAALKIEGDSQSCTDCGVCAKACPMDIDIPEYVKAGTRVLSSECIFCNTCITKCPEKSLKVSFGFDLGGAERIRRRESSQGGGSVLPEGDKMGSESANPSVKRNRTIRTLPPVCFLVANAKLLTGRVHFPKEHVGKVLEMDDGMRFIVFRHAHLRGPVLKSPAIFIARFRFARFNHKTNRRLSLMPIPLIAGFPGFADKLWMVNLETGFWQGVYQFESVEAVEAYQRSFVLGLMNRRAEQGSLNTSILPSTSLQAFLDRHSTGQNGGGDQ